MINEKYIILDRDGVINHDSKSYIKTADEWKPIDRSLEAIAKLTENNFNIIIITNQSGIERGLITPSEFIKINLKMISEIYNSGGQITSILYCPSSPPSQSVFRKPNSGMFDEIASRLDLQLTSCYSIGDSPRDIEASIKAKCMTLAVRTGNGNEIEKNNFYNVPIFDDLFEATNFIISG